MRDPPGRVPHFWIALDCSAWVRGWLWGEVRQEEDGRGGDASDRTGLGSGLLCTIY
jgi:hypothetical protein